MTIKTLYAIFPELIYIIMNVQLLKDFRCAQLVHDTLCAKTDCIDENELCVCGYIVCIDDDPTSALYAARLAKLHKDLYSVMPRILCVGGNGLLSKWTHHTTEGKLLAICCQRLGIPSSKITILDHGTNTGANVQEIAAFVNGDPATVLFVATKRLSLRLQLTVQAQAPKLMARYYVIDESVFEACKWMNGKRIGQGQMMLHELASILNRCDAYAGTFQAPIPFEVPAEVRQAANHLAAKYRLKLPHKNLRSFGQYIWLLCGLIRNRRLIKFDLNHYIKFCKRSGA